MNEEKADVIRSIFEYYLAGASLGKIVDILFVKGIHSPDRKPQMDQGCCGQAPV